MSHSNRLTKAKYLLPAEIAQLQSSLERCLRINPQSRHAIFTLLALETGARCSEILAIEPEDLIAEDRAVYIKGSKRGDARVIPLRSKTFEYLRSIADAKPFQFDDSTARRQWYDLRPVAKKLHSLRHTFAITMYDKTKDIRLVSRLLGHRSIQTTMIYLDYVMGGDELRSKMGLD